MHTNRVFSSGRTPQSRSDRNTLHGFPGIQSWPALPAHAQRVSLVKQVGRGRSTSFLSSMSHLRITYDSPVRSAILIARRILRVAKEGLNHGCWDVLWGRPPCSYQAL